MSYSFTVKAATKAEAKQAVADRFDEVVLGQSVHKVDRDAALAAAGAFVDMLAEPKENDEYQVMINGSLSWSSENVYTGANVNIQAYLRSKI